jgi:hypothetical protein
MIRNNRINQIFCIIGLLLPKMKLRGLKQKVNIVIFVQVLHLHNFLANN